MLKKILMIVAKTIAVIILLYLFIGFVVLPFAAKWVIEDQGTKQLKHPVRVHAVSFNPILLRFGISGLDVQGAQKQTLIGFDRFSVDVSFLNLLRRAYRVESVELYGFKVNVMLLPDGKIDLMDLVPAAPAKPGEAGAASTAPKAAAQPGTAAPAPAPQGGASGSATAVSPAKPAELPLVVVDAVKVRDGQVRFTDQTLQPPFSTTLGKINVDVSGLSTAPDSQATVVFKAILGDRGDIAVETQIKPFLQPLQLETTLTFNNYALDVLTPYVGKYTGRALKDGKMDFKMDYRIMDNKLTASHKILIQRFEFGQKVPSKDALPLPFGLAVALLEDPQGRINISLPVTGDMSDPEFHYWHLIGQVARNFFMKLVTSPFSALASALGGGGSGMDELGYIKFTPGHPDLSDAEKAKIQTLVKGLKDRPKLRLEVNGAYDPAMDWKAIATEVFDKDYATLRKDSTRSDSWVHQELYQRRFGIRDLWALSNSFRDKKGVINETGLDAEIKRQLIEKGVPDKAALEALATARAKVVYDTLLAEGMDTARVKLGESREAQGSMGYVPLEFTLTVFEEAGKDSDEQAAGTLDGAPAESAPLEKDSGAL